MQNCKKARLISKILIIMLVSLITISIFFQAKVMAATIIPDENQYLELRATSINEIEGKDKQVIFELWGHDIEFKGFDVRFSYDGTSFNTSNLETNEYTDDETEYFKFEAEFEENLELFTIPYDGNEENGIRAIVSFDPPATETEHIKEKDGKMIIDTNRKCLTRKNEF